MKNKKTARTRRKFGQEFKDDAVRLVIEKGQTVKSVADDLGIDQSSIGRWRREYLDRPESFENRGDRALTPKEMDQELRQLRSQLRRVGQGANPLKTDFSVPDLRGLFLRGVDHGSDRDPDVVSRKPIQQGGNSGPGIGSFQADQWARHGHSVTDKGHKHPISSFRKSQNIFGAGGGRSAWEHVSAPKGETEVIGAGVSIEETGGNESRPRNAYTNFIIKY